MSGTINIRWLKASDTDLAAIANDLNSDKWQDFGHLSSKFSASSLKKFLADQDNFYLVGYLDSEIAGAVHGYVMQHPAGPVYIYVDEVDTAINHRRKGVASTLMQAVFGKARQLQADEVWLGTEDDNVAAKALYQSLQPTEIEQGPLYSYKLKSKS